MPLDWNGLKNIMLKCVKCGHKFKGEDCILRDRICCPECGYKVIVKLRSPIVKRVQAE